MGIWMRRAGFGVFLVAAVSLLLGGPAGASHDFGDVTDANPFHEEISWLVDEGITEGFDDETFRPTGAVTRQAMAAWLYRFVSAPVGPFADPGFSDVPPEHPFFTEISWLAQSGITVGFPDDTFRPGTSVTRQAFAAFVHRLVSEPAAPLGPSGFSDVGEAHPFADPISWLAASDVTEGFDDGTFRPSNDVSRQAAAAWLFRLVHGWDGTVSFVVSSFEDSHDPGTLRSAIDAAREVGYLPEGSPVPRAGVADEVVIDLPEGSYTLDLCSAAAVPATGDDNNTAGDLDTGTQASVRIRGLNAGATIEQTCEGERVLEHAGTGRLILANLTITGGDLRVPEGSDALGGGVLAGGDVALTEVSVEGNQAKGHLLSLDAAGGGLWVGGSLDMSGGQLSDNHAVGDVPAGPVAAGSARGGGAWVAVGAELSNVALTQNQTIGAEGFAGGEASGGALDVAGDVSLTAVTATSNVATAGSGQGTGISLDSGGMAAGGAVRAEGMVSMTLSTFSANEVRGGEGTFSGGAALGGAINADVVVIDQSLLTGSRAASGDAGGSASAGASGGAVFGRAVEVTRSSFEANAALSPGEVFFNVGVGRGGAIAGTESVAVDRSTFASNLVARGAASTGGAVWGGDVTIINTTLVGNDTGWGHADPNFLTPEVAGEGAAVAATGSLVVRSSTVIDNGSHGDTPEHGSASVLHAPELELVGTVVAGPGGSVTPVCSSATVVTSSAYNWVDDDSCGLADPTDVVDVGGDPMVGALGDNGGATLTMLPDATGPLVDVIPAGQCPVAVDQRGIARPQGTHCDTGAVERE